MYIVVVEADDGSWLSDVDGFDTSGAAKDFAVRMANKYRRNATVWHCDSPFDVEPSKPESLEEWARGERLRNEGEKND